LSQKKKKKKKKKKKNYLKKKKQKKKKKKKNIKLKINKKSINVFQTFRGGAADRNSEPSPAT
jgi:hypothetical protein